MKTAIVCFILIAVLAWVFLCYRRTPVGHITIINRWGGDVVAALKAGWRWALWPKYWKQATVFVSKRTVNIPNFVLVCLYEGVLTRVKTIEVSLMFELDFWGPDGKLDLEKLINYFKLANADGEVTNVEIVEFLKDKIQSAYQDVVQNMTVEEVQTNGTDISNQALAALIAYVEHPAVMLPVNNISLIMNQPVEFADADMAKAYSDRATVAAKLATDLLAANKGVEIAKKNGEAEKARLAATKEAWCINQIPDQAHHWAALHAVELAKAQRDLANSPTSKVVLGAGLTSATRELLAPMSALALLGDKDGSKGGA